MLWPLQLPKLQTDYSLRPACGFAVAIIDKGITESPPLALRGGYGSITSHFPPQIYGHSK